MTLPAIHSRRAFTLVELLVVISIVVLVLAILFPVLAQLRGTARSTTCLTHQRSLAQAYMTYATDNSSRYVSPRTDPTTNVDVPATGVAYTTTHAWVRAIGGNLAMGSTGLRSELPASIEQGALFPYTDRSLDAYRSPLDPTDRVRSYSINAYVGVYFPDDAGYNTTVQLPPGEVNLDTRTMSKITQPSRTMCTISEQDPYGYNRQGWLIDWENPTWFDKPSFWDGYRINMSMIDGSTQMLQPFSNSLIGRMNDAGQGRYDEPQPAPAWTLMRQFLLPGRLP